jgi:uncharacterized protein
MAMSIVRTLMPVVIIASTMGLSSLLLKRSFPVAWQRWIRTAVWRCAVVAMIGFVAWEVLRLLQPHSLGAGIAMSTVSVVFASSIALAVTSIVWAPLAMMTKSKPVDDGRRAFLRRAVGVVPATAVSTGPMGTFAAHLVPVITEVDIRSESVPVALDGLTILQITDLHLGVFIHAAQLRAVVDAVVAKGIQPDLVVLTGDIADDYDQLPDGLAELAKLRPSMGTFASIGNHEIYRGRERAEAIYQHAGVPLLSDNGVLLQRNGSSLWLAGADDPARGLDGPAAFLERTVAAAFAGCPAEVRCRILLSHRPRGFVHAQQHAATLTLSGHTHGAQMAVWGRSLLESIFPESFLLGHYQVTLSSGDTSHLYTSAGTGHWMPFRLNCPCEATLVTLRTVT